jgi:TrmH family RNA methyltransferase
MPYRNLCRVWRRFRCLITLRTMDEDVLSRICVVLVAPSHPGNIGAAARAMWTMGLAELRLVRPSQFPCAEATSRAAGADEVLYRAALHETLAGAVADCGYVVAATARSRRLGWPELGPRAMAREALSQAARSRVALVFGREHSGLTNAELECCHAAVVIPANPVYGSLNLAAAVQILAYELHVAVTGEPELVTDGVHGSEPDRPATVAELEGLYAHLEQGLVDVGYLDPASPKKLMRRLRRLFNRAKPYESEVNILRGVLAATQRAARRDR